MTNKHKINGIILFFICFALSLFYSKAILLFAEMRSIIGLIIYYGEKFMEKKIFTKNDQGFVCANCGKEVEPLRVTSRNHCPFCLHSLHVDVNPGDRAEECRGIMEPVGVETDPKKGYVIIHKCKKCGKISRNKAAHNAKIQPDDIDLIIALSAKHEY